MGACISTLTSRRPVLSTGLINGDDRAYHERFIEQQVLGEGEFGRVKLVTEINAEGKAGDSDPLLACKVLQKGVTFKDNTIYSPLSRDCLRGECLMLRTLAGKHFCLNLHSLWEGPSQIYVVTEYCAGGEMLEYVVNCQKTLRTEDVSRMAFQLLDAVNHCHKHKVIHRDIKPENVMFVSPDAGSPLRLIDFGSGTIDIHDDDGENAKMITAETETGTQPIAENSTAADSSSSSGESSELVQHSTFAGSAFYISPEMFQRTYTCKTDLWSVGATLYVLVAGYPADELQKAFNILQTSKDRDLRKLPNLPVDLPDSFFDMLNDLLRYRHKSRKPANEMLTSEFVLFHKRHNEGMGEEDEEEVALSLDEIARDSAEGGIQNVNGESEVSGGKRRSVTRSIAIRGSVQRHTLFLEYQRFERALTTLLATVLRNEEYESLIQSIDRRIREGEDENAVKLGIIRVSELKDVLESLKFGRAREMMGKLPNASSYDGFAYHVALLRDFLRTERDDAVPTKKRILQKSISMGYVSDEKQTKGFNSVHGNDVFRKWKAARASGLPRKDSSLQMDHSTHTQ